MSKLMSKKINRKKPTQKRVNPKKGKVTTKETGPVPDKFYEYEGKKYALGAIISVGYDPYFVEKSKRGRKSKKSKKIVPDEDVDIEEVEEREEGDEEERDYGEKQKNYDLEIEENEVDSEEEGPDDGIIRKKHKKAIWEKGEIFKEKEVAIFKGAALEIAEKYDLPRKESRLVSEETEYKVADYDVRYRGYDKFVVAERQTKNGPQLYLKHYSPENVNKINIIDGDFLPPPVPIAAYVPEKAEKPKVPENYKGSLRVGDRITFTYKTSKDIEGAILDVGDEDFDIVTPESELYEKVKYKDAQNLRFKPIPQKMLSKKDDGAVVVKDSNGKKKTWKITLVARSTKKDNVLAKVSVKKPYRYAEFTLELSERLTGVIYDYDDEGFIVSVIQNGVADTIVLPYDDSTIKLEKRKGIKDVQVGRVNIAEDYLKLPIKTKTRLHATKQLFQVLASIIPNIYESSVDTNPKLKKIGEDIDWTLANVPLKSWETYYEEQFGQWIFSKKYHEFYAKAPSFKAQSEQEYESSIDPVLIIEGLEYVFGDIFSGNGALLLSLMERKSKEDDFRPTVIDISIRRNLNRLDNEELEKLEGSGLALMIASIIDDTMKTNPPSTPDQIEIRLKQEWTRLKTLEYAPSQKDKKVFDNEYLTILTKNYEDYNRDAKLQKEKKKEYDILRKNLELEILQRADIQSKVQRFKTMSVNGMQLSLEGMLLADNVSMLEEKIHVEVGGKTNENYLRKILRLIMFLDPGTEIGKYTAFLKSKIASGVYEVDQLDSMTYMSMFPEFFANNKYTESTKDDKYENVISQIERQVDLSVLDFIDIWILSNQPRIREKNVNKIIWSRYLELPSESCGGLRIRKGLNYRGLEDSENYDCEQQGESYLCKAKLEPIPDEDLILCYDEPNNKFTCSSIEDVLYALWEQSNGETPVNPMTNKPYGDDFLERMKNRYGDLLKDRVFTKRVLSFKATEDEILFGADETHEVIIPKPKTPEKAKKELTLKNMMKDADGKKLLIVFRPAHLKSSTLENAYKPYTNKLKVVMIEYDEDTPSDFVKSLKFKKQPLFAVYTNKNKTPNVVYLQSIKKKFTYTKALESIL